MKGINIRGAARLAWQSARSVAWAAVFLASMNARAEEAQPPVAVAAHLTDDGDSARLSFDLSGPVEALARPIADPDRIIVDFPEVNFQIDPSVGRVAPPRAGALVKAFRFGLFGPGKSRVVIELGASGLSRQSHDEADRKGGRAIAPDRRAQALRCGSFRRFRPSSQSAALAAATRTRREFSRGRTAGDRDRPWSWRRRRGRHGRARHLGEGDRL